VYRQTFVESSELDRAVIATCATHEPLGAYAAAHLLHYLFVDAQGVLDLASPRPAPGRPSVSVAGEIPLFDWHEREMRDTRDVAFTGLPNERALFIAGDGTIPPALTAEGKGVNIIVVGPVHAGIIEPGRFTFSSGGETVLHLDAQLSYSRRGVERFLQGLDAVGAAPRVARVCAACSVARSWAYARALESLAGVVCDERTEWTRLIFAELERLYNHIFDLSSSSAGAGYGHGQTQGLALKERVHRICAEATGHRFAFDAIVPGGVRTAESFDPHALATHIEQLRGHVDGYLDALFRNRSLVRRFEGAGHVSAETARAFGTVGPARRASGGTIDIRSCAPYGAYRAAPPQCFTETGGDVAARCAVKRLEIGESFKLIERAFAELDGHAPPAAGTLRAGSGTVTTVTEGARGAETVSITCDDTGQLARVHFISASYRNWPTVLRAMEANIVPDFPLVNKSFNLCYACADR
jgi:Ni,Fe-hydrogenase III large subunit